MNEKKQPPENPPLRGVMFNAYPDSIGRNLSDSVKFLGRPELNGCFSLFYILPTFFHSDLDRGFSIIDYDFNEEFVTQEDVDRLQELGLGLKFDLVLNHLSVGSPQFQDLLQHGDDSEYKDFFIDWNEFWQGEGEMGPDGHVVPNKEHLDKLFMRKPGLPILHVGFPDGTSRPYWNTFYQEVRYPELTSRDMLEIEGLTPEEAVKLARVCNESLETQGKVNGLDIERFSCSYDDVVRIVERKRRYLGQMDLNGRSEKVWKFYDETLGKLRAFGARMVRLDAFAYLHKEVGAANFFNKPETWEYLERLREMARRHDLILLPEIHSRYGHGLHDEVASEGFPIYDFFFPGLVIDALDRGTNVHLLRWVREIASKGIRTINMLGCHDGIPVLDLAGKVVDGVSREGLLSDEHVEAMIRRILGRGGRVKNLYGPDGEKIAYYQVNATFFSAIGEDETKMRLARAIQLFMPGIPQVWYLDLFAGRNDYRAADRGGAAGHKEINRTSLDMSRIDARMRRILVRDQLQLIRLRNNSKAFEGTLVLNASEEYELKMTWTNGDSTASLSANLFDFTFDVTHRDDDGTETRLSYR
ncbi:MAG: glycosidase [Deltaproteobacteria bacterium]|nr:glycosidase [Deltaproteobacteria bacterium]